MNIKQASLGILGLGIGVGTILSLAPISPVQAGSLNRNIVNSEGDVLVQLGESNPPDFYRNFRD